MPTFRDFDKKIRAYRKLPKGPLEMGCNVLVAAVLLSEGTVDRNATWPKSIVQGKTFDTETDRRCLALERSAIAFAGPGRSKTLWPNPLPSTAMTALRGIVLHAQPLGAGCLPVLVSEAYSKRCAITGESTFPVLEAAHIRPYELEGGPHRISNGMLLRSDFPQAL
jgi:putative restriction endonuclease